MKRILNFGSLNTDYVYKVDHILQGGETIQSESRTVFPGGKGLNQSIALVRAGLSVCHAGLIGTDGEQTITMEQIAREADTFNYEFVCGVARRVPRIYFKDGKPYKEVSYILDKE